MFKIFPLTMVIIHYNTLKYIENNFKFTLVNTHILLILKMSFIIFQPIENYISWSNESFYPEELIDLRGNLPPYLARTTEVPSGATAEVGAALFCIYKSFLKWCLCHEFHETCDSVTFIVLVNSHQR